MSNFLRPLRPGVFQVTINDTVAAVIARSAIAAFDVFILTSEVVRLAEEVIGSPQDVALRIASGEFDNDFRFESSPNPEPSCNADLYFMAQIATPSQRVLDRFTSEDPGATIEAAREAQVFSLEERFDLYAARGW